MPSRRIPLIDGEYYHIFNRGVAKMQIFNTPRDYSRFIDCVKYYQIEGPKPKFSAFDPDTFTVDPSKKIVEIISYCLMPNHFHFLLKQVRENGISEFISKASNSYTKYINTKTRRVGPLLQGEFKAVHIDSNDQLVHVNRYIHLNPIVGYVAKDLNLYPWSSYIEYIDLSKHGICEKDIVLELFKEKDSYKRFVLDHVDYAKKLDQVKHLLLDLED